jgi:hypothetical protein
LSDPALPEIDIDLPGVMVFVGMGEEYTDLSGRRRGPKPSQTVEWGLSFDVNGVVGFI